MPFNKAAYLRYTLIDACLCNKHKPFPSIYDFIYACEQRLDKKFTISTIQKDIKDLKEGVMGVDAPIKFSRSQEGYYYSDPQFSIQKINLQEEEIEALKASADLLTMFSGSRVSDNFTRAVQKIFASLHEQFPTEKMPRIIQTDTSVNHKGFVHFEFFLHSAKKKIPVCFVHYSYNKRKFQSVILHPLMLKEFQNNWYVVGYSENHRECRTFGLDRVYDPRLLKRKFSQKGERDREQYFDQVYGVYPLPGQELQTLEIMVSPLLSDYLHAHPIHVSQKRREEMKHRDTLFTLQLIPSQELINLFISFSKQLIVLKPRWIQEAIHKQHLDALNYETRYRD